MRITLRHPSEATTWVLANSLRQEARRAINETIGIRSPACVAPLLPKSVVSCDVVVNPPPSPQALAGKRSRSQLTTLAPVSWMPASRGLVAENAK